MKMYTNESQTAKLVELGFEKPKGGISERVSYFDDRLNRKCRYEISEFNYSIGELIEMLPTSVKIKGYDCFLYIGPNVHDGSWNVGYMKYNVELNQRATELIDAVYDMVIILKEEEVI